MRYVPALCLTLLLAAKANAMGYYPPPAAIPEPSAFGMFAAGAVIVGWAVYRRR